jgi:uncharacterized membrane protein
MHTWALLLLPMLLLSAASQPQVLNITLTIYGDGAVRIKEEIQLDPSFDPRIRVYGVLATDILVTTKSGEIANYTYKEGYIATKFTTPINLIITYTTNEITSKVGNRWKLTASLPTNSVIRLPDASTIVKLDPLPTGISNVDITTTLLMPEGDVTIEYYVGITGTQEHALALIDDLDTTIQKLKQTGYNTSSIDSIYTEAKQAYEAKQYVDAETLAMRGKELAVKLGEQASKATEAITTAEAAILEAMNQGRTASLPTASSLLDDSRASFILGNYKESFDLAYSAKQWANQSVVESNSQWFYILSTLTIMVLAVGLIIIFSRKRKPTISNEMKIDVEKIHRDHPEIREDDLPVLKFIADHPNGVYISKLRESIGMPRSTAWRTVARLEELGVIQTSQIGRETFIRIKANSQ